MRRFRSRNLFERLADGRFYFLGRLGQSVGSVDLVVQIDAVVAEKMVDAPPPRLPLAAEVRDDARLAWQREIAKEGFVGEGGAVDAREGLEGDAVMESPGALGSVLRMAAA